MDAAADAMLYTASYLEAARVNDAGEFVWTHFERRAGIITEKERNGRTTWEEGGIRYSIGE